MSEWTYIIVAYALTWVTLGGFATYLWRRAKRAERTYASTDPNGG